MSTGRHRRAPTSGRPNGARRAGGLWQRALGNVKSGNLGVLPVVIGEILIVAYFSFTATNFFTASNFVNVILQMAGVTMIAFGVVFVLLIAEIDLSIGFLSGIAALTAAQMQLPDGRNYPGWLCILIALGVVAIIGAAQGTFVAKVGVPSFVVTLAGLLIWQGVILRGPPGARRDHHRGGLDQQDGDVLLLRQRKAGSSQRCFTGRYALVVLSGLFGQRRAGLTVSPVPQLAKIAASRLRHSASSRSAHTRRGRRHARRARR